jgi:excisionase family DNA binding protein
VPTLEEIKTWPATVSVGQAASALGVSRSHLYEQLRLGAAPVGVVRVGTRVRIVTASVLSLLGGKAAA